jgi:hypothetical protein
MGSAFMWSELTNHYNESGIMHHLQYNKLLLRKQMYQDFIHNHIRPFANLSGGASGYIWELYPDAVLRYEQNNTQFELKLSDLPFMK